ncbi:hypothetical protein [Hyphobacterium sp.]|uniref:hypothetical protein n=1 Tax=Hyphobacterium sp. TaxID=2004662 RepID=UPI0037499798
MIRNVITAVLGLLIVLIGAVYFLAWRSPATMPRTAEGQNWALMSWQEYSTVASQYQAPVIREVDPLADGAVLFFGAEHSGNIEHPQFAALEQALETFQPSVVLVEGRLGFLLPGVMDPVETYGESGFAVAQARRRGLNYFSWELDKADEIAALREQFSQEQVALFIIMRPFLANNWPNQDVSPEDRLAGYIRDRGDRPGIEGTITGVEDVEAIWARDFAGETDWRDLRFGTSLPSYLGELFEYANDVRDAHLLDQVMRLTGEGERVLVVAGWSHVVRIEPVFASTGN